MVGSGRLALLCQLLLVLLVACGEDVTGIGPGDDEEPALPATALDSSLLLSASSELAPSEVRGDEFFFDLSSVDLVVRGVYNDFEFGHPRVLYKDMHVEAFNVRTQEWVPVADNESFNCTTTFQRSFLDVGLVAMDFVDDDYRMRLRAAPGTASREYQIRVLMLDKEYAPWSLANAGSQYGGFDFDGSSAWLAERNVHQVSALGVPVHVINTSAPWSCAVAKGPENVWATGDLGNGSGVYEFDEDGTALRGFLLGTYFCCDMTFGTDDMWLLGTDQPNVGGWTLSQVDIDASCKEGTVQFLRQLDVSSKALSVASDGTHLYLATNTSQVRIDEMKFDGTLVESHTIDVQWVGGLAWDQGLLWALHAGPTGVHSRYVVSAFRWPE